MTRVEYSIALLAMLALLARPAAGLHFFLVEGSTRCFLEDVPDDTMVVGKYKNPDITPSSSPDAGSSEIRIFIVEPVRQEEIFSEFAEKEGKFVFHSHEGGEHKICLASNRTNYFGRPRKLNFELHLDVGEAATDYADLAKVEHLTAIEVEVRKLNDKIRAVRAEQNYQRRRERAFTATSESTNSRVMWWSIIQTLVLVISGVWQILYLKSFFKKKKLV